MNGVVMNHYEACGRCHQPVCGCPPEETMFTRERLEAKAEDEAWTLDELRAWARLQNAPGPDVVGHPVDENGELFNGECYCRECLSS